jgi:hypothetical protein
MPTLLSLWLPIVLAAVIVFVASSIIHMTPLWHKSDYPKMPREAEVRDALRPFAVPPGDYFIPRASGMSEMRTPEFKDKMAKGPVAILTVLPNGPIAMGRNLSQWFIFLLVVSAFVALVTCQALPVNTPYPRVFMVAGTVAFIGYGLALCELSIWYRRAWSLTLKSLVDAVIYGALTAGTFGWLWPRYPL